jgi:hypothetical protein
MRRTVNLVKRRIAWNLRLAFCFSIVLAVNLAACAPRQSPHPPHPPPSGTPLVQKTPLVRNVLMPQSTPIPCEQGPEPQEPYLGMWISGEELACLPTSGVAWEQLKAVADQESGQPDLGDQNDNTNVAVLAKALVYARTGKLQYRDDVVAALRIITFGNTEVGALALGRELAAYVIAADLIALANYDPDLDAQFRDKLRELLSKKLDARTLQSTHEDRPNNWGTHAGASRAAVAVYLGDAAELERAAQVFKGWLGDRNSYAGFTYGRLSWQADPHKPVGINPKGAMKEGHSIDGAQPEEMRRGGKFRWPPKETGYAWEGLQGALVQAEILHRAGYPAWEWEDRALLRAVQFLYDIDWEPEGDDEWQPWLVNYAYDTAFPATTPARPGKNMAWTDWTHSAHRAACHADAVQHTKTVPELSTSHYLDR